MTLGLVTAILLIAVPIAFNVAFFELGRAFDYPGILRKPPEEVLRRFAAGGSGLVLRWQALSERLGCFRWSRCWRSCSTRRRADSLRSSSDGGGPRTGDRVVRWPFAVPELARRYVAAEGPDAGAEQRAIVVQFATLNRLFGVGIGEHLGYLLTGLWTLIVGISIVGRGPSPVPEVLPAWIGIVGLPIGVALLVGSLEFVGRNEPEGELAGTIVPIAYIAWSLWLVVIGILLLV